MPYEKPHLSFESQLQLLMDRGLLVDDHERAKFHLSIIGYYRLSAYLYPFRLLKPVEQRSTAWSFRFDEFQAGSKFEDAIALYEFDSELRRLLFQGLETFEIALRSQIAHHAGQVDVFIHLHRQMLDPKECSKRPKRSKRDSYQIWFSKYKEQMARASGEDFMKHHRARYGGEIPIWIAMEVIDFGSVTHLFSFLPVETKNKIARAFGVTQGKIFSSWLRSFNYLRNVVAHHSRIWNRVLVMRPRIPVESSVKPEIHHLSEGETKKLYPPAALLAYTLRSIEPLNDWNVRAASVFCSFPSVDGLSLQGSMGFPQDWETLDLWLPRPS